MNKLNVLLSVLATVLIILTTSCGGEKNENSDEAKLKAVTKAVTEEYGETKEVDKSTISNADNAKIKGTWKVVKAEGKAASQNEGKTYDFKEDGSAVLNGVENKGYSLGGTTLTIDYNGMEEMYSQWTVTFDGDKKVKLEKKDDDLKVWLEKQ